MADATLSETINCVLEHLMVLEGGETAEAEDAALITRKVLSCNEKLRTREICYWSDAAFPQDIVEDFAVYVACHAVTSYPSPTNLAKFDKVRMDAAFAELKRLTSSRERVDEPTKAEFF